MCAFWTLMRGVGVDKLTINMTKRKEKKERKVRMPEQSETGQGETGSREKTVGRRRR